MAWVFQGLLSTIANRRGADFFKCTYSWTYHGKYSVRFEPELVKQLNTACWIPDGSGDLASPSNVCFSELGWKPNETLLSIIKFKSEKFDILAKEVGLDSTLLGLMVQLAKKDPSQLAEVGLIMTNMLEAKNSTPQQIDSSEPISSTPNLNETGERRTSSKLQVDEDDVSPAFPVRSKEDTVSIEAASSIESETNQRAFDENPIATSSVADKLGKQVPAGDSSKALLNQGSEIGGRSQHVLGSLSNSSAKKDATKQVRSYSSRGYKEFISFIALQSDDHENDPDGLTLEKRLAIEEEAISLIISKEPGWNRTPTNNAGFDLYRGSSLESPHEVCEVKSMSSTLADRPVAISRAQLECALQFGGRFWLYIIERAGTENASILRISDPVGKATSFSFDRGWRTIAIKDTQPCLPPAELDSLIDPACKTLLDGLRNTLSTLAFVEPEIGFELTDKNGAVVAYAELAWPTRKVAVLVTEEDAFEFLAHDWQCWTSGKDCNSNLQSGLQPATVESLKSFLLE